MFDKIGKFSTRFRYPIILFWAGAAILITLLAPNLGSVSISDQSSFLSASAPSIKAADLEHKYFPELASSGSIVILLHSANGKVFDNPAIPAYITTLTDWLQNKADPTHTIVTNVMSPADPTLKDRLTSKDGQLVIFNVAAAGSMEGTETNKILKTIQDYMKNPPAGIDGYVTGGLAIAHDYKKSALNSASKTTMITVVLVIVILLTIYRSPVLPLVPLVTIGIAYGISRGLVAWLAQAGMVISSFTDVFMVVLMFGAGTDYCLFIVSRFREFMADDYPSKQSAHNTIARVGETIASSAGTVIVGTIAMSFVELKIFANSGPSLALGIFVSVLAGLTLTPALLAALGKHAFWPGRARHAGTRAIWGRLAAWVADRPWLPLVLALVILVPLALYGMGAHRNFDLLADLPANDPPKVGFEVLSQHFGAGELQPQDVIMTNLPDGHSPQGIAAIDSLTKQILALPGVADVRSLSLPAGKGTPEIGQMFRVETQLKLIASGIQSLASGGSDPTTSQGNTGAGLSSSIGAGSLSTLTTYLSSLAKAFPELASNADYQTIVTTLGKLQTNSQALLFGLPVSSQLAMIGGNLSQALDQAGGSSQTSSGADQLTFLSSYLAGLSQAYPAVTQMDGYADALAAAGELNTEMASLGQLMILPNQLGMIAGKFEETVAALQANPLALVPQQGQPSTADQMTGLKNYINELGDAFLALKATADYTNAQAAIDTVIASSSGNIDMAKIGQAITTLAKSFRGLANTAAASLPQATFIPEATIPGLDATAAVGETLAKLSSALTRLSSAVKTAMPDAKFIPPTINAEQMQAAAAGLANDVSSLEGALNSLAATFAQRPDGFFLPAALISGDNAKSLTDMVNMYVSANGDASRLQVVLVDEPYSDAAINTVALLRTTVASVDHGSVSGGTAVLNDLRDAMARDMRLVMILVLSGIAVVMVLLLRSLVAPLYLILTILLSYATTLGITRLLFEGILHTELTWFVPFFIFTLLMSLGMDYNIFLMGRVKEETDGNGSTRAGVQRAMERTGGIITSAGIIMAGTFAAMLSSSLIGLVQLAFAITIGVLLDTFLIRTTLVPAIAMLLGRWNWWPRKKA